MKPGLIDKHPVALLLLLVVLFFWKLVFSGHFSFLNSPDMAFQVLPWYQVQASAWQQGVFPLWDPFQWGGQPLLGQMQPGAAFPLNWPLFLAPLKNGHIHLRYIHWHFVVMHMLAALFMYALVRELGRSRYASFLAGLAFTCAGHLGTLGWPQMLNGVIWMPLVFLFFHRACAAQERLRTFTYAALAGGAIGFSLLSGHHQAPFFLLLALTGLFFYFLHQRWQESPAQAARLAGLYAVVALAAFFVSALQLLPAAEYGSQAVRWVGAPDPVGFDEAVPFYVHAPLRLYPVSLLGTVVPTLHFETNTYIGVFLLSMAILGIAAAWSERWVRVYSFMAIGGLAYTFGPYSIVQGWIYALVPFADKARTAGHAAFVYQFALIVLAAYGIDRLFRADDGQPPETPWFRYIQKALLGFGGLLLLFLMQRAVNGEMGAQGDPFMLAALAALFLAAVLHALARGLLSARAVRWCVLGLMVFELASPNWYHFLDMRNPEGPKYIEELTSMRGVAAFLKSQPQPFRFEVPTKGFQPNIGDWEGMEAVDGYLASVDSTMLDFLSPDWTQGRLLLNNVYTVAKEKTREIQEEVYTDPTGWKVFRNPDAYPRAWVAHSTKDITSDDRLAGVPRLENCEGGDVTVRRDSVNTVQARVRVPCRSIVIFSEPYFPGWHARIDGEPKPILRAYRALRALEVPAGEHHVEFVYRPTSVILGGTMTALGLFGCLLLCGVARKRGVL